MHDRRWRGGDADAAGEGEGRGAPGKVTRTQGIGAPLPAAPRAQFEQSLGADLGGVRVHTSAESAEAASAIGARAYTTGQDIHFGAGQYQVDDPFGMHLLAHEVAHTVQQGSRGGAPQPKLEVSTPGDALEREADHAAEAMVRGDAAAVSAGAASSSTVHRFLDLAEMMCVDPSTAADGGVCEEPGGYTPVPAADGGVCEEPGGYTPVPAPAPAASGGDGPMCVDPGQTPGYEQYADADADASGGTGPMGFDVASFLAESSGNVYGPIMPGMTGPEVEALQRRLGLPVTGTYGGAEIALIQTMQLSMGLPPTGIADPFVLGRLNRKDPSWQGTSAAGPSALDGAAVPDWMMDYGKDGGGFGKAGSGGGGKPPTGPAKAPPATAPKKSRKRGFGK